MRKDFLDGIRGWAALMVVFSHLIQNFAAQAAPSLNKSYLRLPTDGALAVYIFFVVSGFALSTGYFASKSGTVITSLALRRYVRLTIPIFASSAFAFVLTAMSLMFNQRAGIAANSPTWLAVFYTFPQSVWDLCRFSFFDVYFNYNGLHTYNPALWTMSIELAGSALVFGILAIFGDTRLPPIYLIAAIVCIACQSAMLAFVLGVALADWFQHRTTQRDASRGRDGYIGFSMTLVGLSFSYWGRRFYGEPVALSLAAFLIVAGIASFDPVRNFFECRISRILGKLSFPLYLTHLPIMCSLSSFVFIRSLDHGLSQQAATNIMVVTSLPVMLIAAAVFEPIEQWSIYAARWVATIFVLTPSTSRVSSEPKND